MDKSTKENTYEPNKSTQQKEASSKKSSEGAKHTSFIKEKGAKAKKQLVIERIKSVFSRNVKEEIPQMWTGQTSVLDVISPSSVDNGSRDYIVVDGVYHAYLYVAGYGYRTRNEAAWLSPLVEAGENIGISFTFKKIPRDKSVSFILNFKGNVFEQLYYERLKTDYTHRDVFEGVIDSTLCAA